MSVKVVPCWFNADVTGTTKDTKSTKGLKNETLHAVAQPITVLKDHQIPFFVSFVLFVVSSFGCPYSTCGTCSATVKDALRSPSMPIAFCRDAKQL